MMLLLVIIVVGILLTFGFLLFNLFQNVAEHEKEIDEILNEIKDDENDKKDGETDQH